MVFNTSVLPNWKHESLGSCRAATKKYFTYKLISLYPLVTGDTKMRSSLMFCSTNSPKVSQFNSKKQKKLQGHIWKAVTSTAAVLYNELIVKIVVSHSALCISMKLWKLGLKSCLVTADIILKLNLKQKTDSSYVSETVKTYREWLMRLQATKPKRVGLEFNLLTASSTEQGRGPAEPSPAGAGEKTPDYGERARQLWHI